ncbi:alkaline phosphatase [Desertivirga brevis]|uniref:alkaline phosphatase n=1 Tax=Desertivirga brevis TaxID=2810310 RepID=UPI001A95D263|nr:alkaline phosphatase [Pedobacter sp. SYSU D00873]
MNRKIFFPLLSFLLVAGASSYSQTSYNINRGHSHNDYEQDLPFLRAYHAGIGSIEADVFVRNGKLLVAHEEKSIDPSRTLDSLYLKPISRYFRTNKGRIYADTSRSLQLVIDLKDNYKKVMPVLIQSLKAYRDVFDPEQAQHPVRIVLSGDIPPPAVFSDFPDYIFFDGRPAITYSGDQLKRVGMISDALGSYSSWNGKGTPTPQDLEKLRAVVTKAHQLGKPFRFWATKDNPTSWMQLENLGADWIGTDHPDKLGEFYAQRDKTMYQSPKTYSLYQPSYKRDGTGKSPKNIILLIGDGMGFNQIQAALAANGGALNLSSFRNIGFSGTSALNSDITDSAAGATAMATGQKTNNRYIGVDSAGKDLTSLTDRLAAEGMSSGIISNADITDATPAAFYAHRPERSMSFDIARDFLNSKVDILIGSNRKSFTDNPDKTLVPSLKKKGYSLLTSLDALKAAESGRHLVLLDDSVCRPVKDGRGDMLSTALTESVRLLSKGKGGFFIMAEGAQIDYGGHANDLPYVITELHDFDRMVGEALSFADKDGETLVVVTADHETGGLSLLDASAANRSVRGTFSTDDHTGVMVPVFAYGPGAREFTGVYPNSDIYHKILKVLKKKGG